MIGTQKISRFWLRPVILMGLAVTIALSLVACRPTAAPTPVIPPAIEAPTAQKPAAPVSAPNPQEAALAQLVAAAQKEGKVTVYAVAWTGDVGLKVSRAFKDRYGIKMEIITGKGAEFLERIKTERRIGQMVADFQEGSAASMAKARMEGLTQSLRDLPALQEEGVWDIHPLSGDKEGFSAGYRYQGLNFWVNTNLVPASEEPHSFRDLLQPRWKGKMVIGEPTINSGPYQMLVPLVNNKALDWEIIKALGRQDLKYARTTNEIFVFLARGEAHLTPVGPDQYGFVPLVEGAPLKPIAPEEGTVVSISGAAVIKNAPNPQAARLLVNWLLTKDGQTTIMEAISNISIRKDGPDFRPVAGRVKPKKFFVESEADSEEEAVKMRDRFLPNLWK